MSLRLILNITKFLQLSLLNYTLSLLYLKPSVSGHTGQHPPFPDPVIDCFLPRYRLFFPLPCYKLLAPSPVIDKSFSPPPVIDCSLPIPCYRLFSPPL